ncbi:Mediator of RNA polymerase II transcription subunit 15a [Cardamine amara subsp. amara]|uniref:Mediator of RNA polymerase II transcription subunit 15a n=1 Tax=Cardamine amara subsp. amara TaxID=228776 RepID=A0ABD1BWM6_CARAN
MKNANGDDWREELYLKVRSIREMCLAHLHELYQTTEDKLQHQESLLPQQRSDEFEKLKRFKTTLERMIYFLSLPKSKILPELKHNIAYCEKQIMDLLMKHGPKQLPQSQTIHGMQQNASSSKLGSRLEPGQGSGLNNGIGGDWQEQVFQKIQSLKDMYLAELNEIYKKIVIYQQHNDSIPQQQRPDHFEKLIEFKTMLERMMQFLTVSKTSIMPALKDKVAYYEKHIIDFLNKYRPRKTVQQGQLPQSQTIQDQSHDNQTNPKMKSMSMQVSGTRAQESSMPYMQNNVLSSLPRVSGPQQNIPSFIPASSLESSGQGNALNYGQQMLAMGSMQQNTSQQVNNGSASAQSGLWTLHSNVNQTQQNIPSFIPASSLESGQGNALNYGQQVLTMGSMLQVTSQQVKNGSASAQSGLWTLHSNVNQTQLSSILIQNQQQQDQLMELKRQYQHRQMQQQQQMPQQMTQQLKQQLQYRQMQQQQLLQQVNQLQQHLQARQQDQQIMQQLQQHQMQQRQQPQMQQQQQLQQYQMQQHQQPQTQQQNMSSSIHVMQERQQPQIQQQNMSSSIPASNLELGQGSGLNNGNGSDSQNMSSSIHAMQQQNMSSSIPASNLELGQGSGLNNANGSDLQEELFQKFKYMKETYLADLKELYQRVVASVQQQKTLPPQERSDKYEKQTEFKMVLEHIIRFLSVSKRTTSPASKDLLDFVESQIILYLKAPSHRPAEQGQLPQT